MEPEVSTLSLFPSPPAKQPFVFIAPVDIFSPCVGQRRKMKVGGVRKDLDNSHQPGLAERLTSEPQNTGHRTNSIQ